jgi:hypothetical protein
MSVSRERALAVVDSVLEAYDVEILGPSPLVETEE